MALQLPFATGIASQEYLTAEEGAIRAHEDGYSHWYVDMSLPSDHAHEWTPQRLRALKKTADTFGLTPIIHGNFRAPLATEIPEIQTGVVAYLNAELELASELGAPLIVHGGAFVDPRPTESGRWAALQRFIAIMEKTLALAENLGVEVWIENLSHYPKFRPFTYVFTRYTDFVGVHEHFPTVKYIFDVGHANVNQSPPLQLFREFPKAIGAISVSDNDGKSDSHLGLGRGCAPIEELVAAIVETNWQGVVAFETRGAAVSDGVETLKAHVASLPERMSPGLESAGVRTDTAR
jgi:L-ribulose-5-phosphate 3-epimerase